MMQSLKASVNMSNEFGSKYLSDPINYQISNVRPNPPPSGIHPRYESKPRESKEKDYFSSFRISDSIQKRTNPTRDYIKQKEEELRKTKQLLAEMEAKRIKENGMASYEKLDNECKVSANLLKVVDAQVNLLKNKSAEEIEILSKSADFKNLKKKKLFNVLEEPDMDTQFLAANDNRIQALKHCQTFHKPEYIPLEELEKIKSEHEKQLLDIEDEYYGRKKISAEELARRKELKKKLERMRQLGNMIQRPGYNNDNPLDEKDIAYIYKFGNYLKKKSGEYDKIGYEEEWNTTKIQSQNANGLVNRTDGLPGYLDIDDYKLYYYNINPMEKKLNFERPLLIHPHSGKENTLKKTFRNEPGYESTMGKFYVTGSDFNPGVNSNFNNTFNNNFNNTYNGNFNNNLNNNFNNNVNNKFNNKKNLNLNIDATNNNYYGVNNINNAITNQSIQIDNQNEQQNSYIKMIFNMLPKNTKGLTPTERIISEMKLDENMVNELGFENKEDFANKLKNFYTKEKNYMSEDEFTYFLLHKGENQNLAEQNKDIKCEQLCSETGQNFYNASTLLNTDDYLPGLDNNVFDFLKNPSTRVRLKHVNKTLKNKHSRSMKNFNINKGKNDEKNIQNKFINTYTPINKLNKSFDNKYAKTSTIPENNNTNDNFYHTNFNFNRYNKKSDINFTIPDPYNFLRVDYTEKKLQKMKEILEERKKNEDEVFKHTFHANPLNEKMFDTKGNLGNIIEREKLKRKERVDLKKNEIIANMRPFSFYDRDFVNFVKKKNQECIPPEFIPFKANKIQWKSQVNIYNDTNENTKKERQEKIHKRALETFNNAALPPRMEMHEKQKKLQEEEKKIIEKNKIKQEKQQRLFKAKNAPNFSKLHDKFLGNLEKKKKAAVPTVPCPFTFHEPKRKAENCNYLDNENNPQSKNPQKLTDINMVRKKMQKKPLIEPATTKSLNLLMETRRKELETKKHKEEEVKREDEQRFKRQNRLNDRVRGSNVMVSKKKEREERIRNQTADFKQKLKDDKKKFKQNLEIINQKVENSPLMMEKVVSKRPMQEMNK